MPRCARVAGHKVIEPETAQGIATGRIRSRACRDAVANATKRTEAERAGSAPRARRRACRPPLAKFKYTLVRL
eukprot:303524-Prymnesium_polylepis.1